MKPHNCFLLHLLFNLYFFVRSESPVVCSSDSESCKIHEDNLLESVGNVGNIDECRQLCYDKKVTTIEKGSYRSFTSWKN